MTSSRGFAVCLDEEAGVEEVVQVNLLGLVGSRIDFSGKLVAVCQLLGCQGKVGDERVLGSQGRQPLEERRLVVVPVSPGVFHEQAVAIPGGEIFDGKVKRQGFPCWTVSLSKSNPPSG
ncbi:MAG: hypothetical protein IPM82_19590 [Saprospiraceae bacterium]|nr:hypothetical protein [Saprospiraceae bacterium]